MTRTDSKPWYQQFWPWFIIAIPASSVVMGVIMINLAMNGKDSLVRKDWYKDGMAINERQDKQLKAKELGIQARLTVDRTPGDLFIDTQTLNIQQNNTLTLELVHPTLEANDRAFTLHLAPNSRFYAKLDFEPQGLYYLLLTNPTQQWEIESRVNFDNELQSQDLTPNS